jgi:hypothetical protein
MTASGMSLSVLGLTILLTCLQPARGQQPQGAAEAARLLVEQLRRNPAQPSMADGQIGLYVIDAAGGEAVLVASEPAPGFCQCGSSAWSRDGRRIYFDNTLGNSDHLRTHIKALYLEDGRPTLVDLGQGNCPYPSPTGKQVVFIVNPGAIPGAQSGVWLMNADGTNRRRLEGYGRPKWSPDGQQFLIISFGEPREVSLIDIRPGRKSDRLQVPDRNIYTPPNWAGEGVIVAILGEGAGDTIALLDVTSPKAKIKETLWRRGQGADIKPLSPVYAPETGTCVFVGEQEGKGLALYSILRGRPGPPKRLEADGFDHLLQSLSISPGGRFVTFSSDRPARRRPIDIRLERRR